MTRLRRMNVALIALMAGLPIAGNVGVAMAKDGQPAVATAGLPAWAHAPVVTVEGISEYHLPNGLRVLLFPDDSASNVTVNMTFFVGSRHEGRGEKGMAHLLEHMVFKGTPDHPDVWKLLQDHGAQFNGTTWTDRTNYYETLVANDENLEFALKLEADRAVNSFIDADALAKEMSVVRNEFEMGENSPTQIMMKNLAAKAYTWHPYGNSTIGNRSDIERVPADSLRKFYKHYYRPENAMLVVAGKFDPAKTLGLINKYYSPLTNPKDPITDTYTEEPTQDGSRFFTVQREGSQASVGFFYHTPAAGVQESAAVDLLADVLGDRPAGRLYKALVEPGLAATVSCFGMSMAERGSMLVIITLKEGQDPKIAHDKAREILEGLASNPITNEEVERAKTDALRNYKILLSDSNQVGVALTDAAASGDWRLLFLSRDWTKAVTAADVNKVATKYLVENNRTSGMFNPTKNPVRAEIPSRPDVTSLVKDYKGTEQISQGEAFEATPENIESRTKRVKMSDTVSAAFIQKENRGDKVEATVSIRFGTEAGMKGKQTAASLAGAMLRRGAAGMSFQQINDTIDKAQSELGVFGGAGTMGARITSDRTNLVSMLDLATKIMRQPEFPAAEFETLKKERIAGIESQLTQPNALAQNAMQRATSPFEKGSFFYVRTLQEQLDELKATTLDDVKSFYKTFMAPAKVEIAVVGDYDQEAITKSLTAMFDGWKSTQPYAKIVRPVASIPASQMNIDTPDKPMAMVMMATAFEADDAEPQNASLEMANYILGQSATSRMFDRLRQKEGLSYGAGSFLNIPTKDFGRSATLGSYAICASPNALKAMAAMKEEMTKWVNAGVTEEELSKAKEAWKLEYLGALAEDGNVAGMLSSNLYTNRTMQWDIDQLKAMQNLTTAQVNEAIKQRFSGAQFVEIIAGDVKATQPEKTAAK
jgi:zinc protease